MIYLDNAATSFPKPPCVTEAMSRFLAEDAANPGRSGHRMAVRAERMLDDLRLKLTRFFDGEDAHRMIFTMNCTDAINMAIKGLLPRRINGRVPHVISSVLEHNSVSRPLQAMSERGQIELTRVDCDDQGRIDPADIEKAIQPHTLLIAVTHASNVLGTIQDAQAIGQIARRHDLIYLLDAAQSAGVVPISIRRMNIDLLAFPGHKSLLGPTGTGGLYVGPRLTLPEAVGESGEGEAGSNGQERSARELSPWREGGTGGDSTSPVQPGLFPYYLEGGTPNTVGLAGLMAAADYTAAHGAEHLKHERQLVGRLLDGLAGMSMIHVLGPATPEERVGAVSIDIEGYEPADIGAIMDDSFNIAVRPGLHCSPYIHKRMGTYPAGALRISPGPFSTEADIDAALDALKQLTGG
ncbi:MAG: aminotransferase class V-fold PLP-dependent enzyme [Phycisphaeraceae bacterium]|nr:aminotransferase class V-fold PLP-dependent enzyme [Phycisphaeraceae bacterium]